MGDEIAGVSILASARKPTLRNEVKRSVRGKRFTYARADIASDDYREFLDRNMGDTILPFVKGRNYHSKSRRQMNPQNRTSMGHSQGVSVYPKHPIALDEFRNFTESNDGSAILRARRTHAVELPMPEGGVSAQAYQSFLGDRVDLGPFSRAVNTKRTPHMTVGGLGGIESIEEQAGWDNVRVNESKTDVNLLPKPYDNLSSVVRAPPPEDIKQGVDDEMTIPSYTPTLQRCNGLYGNASLPRGPLAVIHEHEELAPPPMWYESQERLRFQDAV